MRKQFRSLESTYRYLREASEESLAPRIPVSEAEAKRVGGSIGVDFEKIDLEQFRRGMEAEFEHGKNDPQTNVTDDDPIKTGKITLAHLKEIPDYYDRLDKLESEARKTEMPNPRS
jgi:hypothetical protein